MPSAIAKRTKPASRRRSINVNRPQPTAAITVTGVSFAGSVATITFDQPVILNGVPAYVTDIAGPVAISAALTSPLVLALTFSATVAAAVDLHVPYEDPGIRNSSGGFVATSRYVV